MCSRLVSEWFTGYAPLSVGVLPVTALFGVQIQNAAVDVGRKEAPAEIRQKQAAGKRAYLEEQKNHHAERDVDDTQIDQRR